MHPIISLLENSKKVFLQNICGEHFTNIIDLFADDFIAAPGAANYRKLREFRVIIVCNRRTLLCAKQKCTD